ncbi:MAG: bifunctional glutamate N-acetyltransferase/amino-acid acetyltransferase ArgJ [Anaerolineae bacterium]|nr:bifunctional glutamate N-acetyltransferase/amino-acid acetyltransferase ArgJ [Anaerolineae bacterium]
MFTLRKEGSVTSAAGFTAVAVPAGLKKENQLDLALVYSRQDCSCAAVFTTNQVVAAPVIVDRETLAMNNTAVRAIIANAKNANACTGEPGLANARETQRLAAAALGIRPDQVLLLSTGVIGVQLPMGKIRAGVETAVEILQREGAEAQRGGGIEAARAIMTTDTRPKHLAVAVELPNGVVTIGGMAKGAGMIHPNMATMLAVITTDAQVAPEVLQTMLGTAVHHSFNRISVDGDTSTNDTVLLLANGASGTAVANEQSRDLFAEALTFVCTELAKMIVKDGEGATKFVEIQVTGAATDAEAHAIANTIATSPLVKTAFAGSDPNWGRILAAAGRAGIPFDSNQTGLWVGIPGAEQYQLVAQGTPTDYQEADAAHVFAQPEFEIQLQVGMGVGTAVVWTCDLSHDYVSINADYRT